MIKVLRKFIFVAYVIVALAPIVLLQGKDVDKAFTLEHLHVDFQQ